MIEKLLPWRRAENGHQLAKNSHYNSFLELQKQMNNLFNNFFDNNALYADNTGVFNPEFEVSETDKTIEVSAELPGMEEDNVDISIENNVLKITGEKRSEEKKDDKNYHFTERSYGAFKRCFSLPEGLALDKVEAKFKDGVLTMHLPKNEEYQQKVTKIKITK